MLELMLDLASFWWSGFWFACRCSLVLWLQDQDEVQGDLFRFPFDELRSGLVSFGPTPRTSFHSD
jgi:hypothetical protein